MKRTLTVLILVATATAAEAGSCGEFVAEYACPKLDGYYRNQRALDDQFNAMRIEDAIRDAARLNAPAYVHPPAYVPPSWTVRDMELRKEMQRD